MSIGSVSDDDDSTTPNSSPDTSFDMTTASVNRSENHISANPLLVNDGPSPAILETMPSYEELQFLLRELQKLRSHIPCLSFGNNNIWKIAPPVNQWPSQRRAAFTNWAKTYFGFTVRSAGMGFTYIQISKARGMEILAKVEQADAEYGQKIEPTEPVVAPSSLSPSPHADTTLFTSPCTNHIHSSPDIDQKQTFCLNKYVDYDSKTNYFSCLRFPTLTHFSNFPPEILISNGLRRSYMKKLLPLKMKQIFCPRKYRLFL
jgi:hypothetical protein